MRGERGREGKGRRADRASDVETLAQDHVV
jgi:hypothetical protein